MQEGNGLIPKKRTYKIRKSLYMEETLLDELEKICLQHRCTFNALAIHMLEKGVKEHGQAS